MQGKSESLKIKWPYYILLFAIFPVLSLLSSNIGQVPLMEGLRSGAILLSASLVVFALLFAVIHDAGKAGLITALAQLLFFTYGHVMSLLEMVFIFKLQFGQHAYLLPVWLVIFIMGSAAVLRKKRLPVALTNGLNLVGICLVVMPAGQILLTQITSSSAYGFAQASITPALVTDSRSGKLENLPDIYYIVLDAYTREDALKEDYGYENGPFLNELREMGFNIPDCTQSNYSYTAMSLASTLNMDYLENISTLLQRGDQKRNYIVYKDLIAHSTVRNNFTKMGYRFVAFETGFWWADVNDADIFLSEPGGQANSARVYNIRGFEETLIGTTGLRLFQDLQFNKSSNDLFDFRNSSEQHYQTVLSDFDYLSNLASLRGPKFVYAHIVSPHLPFVLGADGSYSPTSDRMGYLHQVQYLNQRMIRVVKEILSSSNTMPIIIIQGDHGWDTHNRMKILNAYYLPEGGSAELYPTITPVNTFRLIFDHYFGGNYGLVSDTSHFSEEKTVYQFTTEPQTCVNSH
jgi:hypothetical protein